MKSYLKRFFIFMIIIGLSKISIADHITVSGEVSGTWSTDTVMVTGDINIPDGETLLINPGTRVQFQGSYVFNVAGTIIASGNMNDSIFFQVADTAGFHNDTIPDGGWQGIRFDHNRFSNDQSVFYHCRFSFGKNVNNDTLVGNGGAISIKAYHKVTVDECRFTNNFATYNGGAVSLDSADISIHNSVFSGNRCGLPVAPWGYGGAISSDHSNPDIRWNVFTGNSSTGIGGALSVRYEDCDIYNNIFSGNLSALGGALGILHIPEINHRVNTNFFTENTALYFGGGVASIEASPVYINNTIANNSATYGGGFYCRDSISPDFYNTIIWGNTAAVGPQGYFFEVFSQADFFYCDVEGGPSLFGGSGGGAAFSGAFEMCLDEDPEFLGFGSLPFSIYVDSPCFNAGSSDTTGFMLPSTDLEYNPRVVLGAIDIGADEVYPFSLEEPPRFDDNVQVWPNPTDGKFRVQSVKFKEEIRKVELVDIFGKCVIELETKGINDPVEINISHLPPGIYFAIISAENISITKKLVKVSR
jgi:predicted outer membrane repeat protein